MSLYLAQGGVERIGLDEAFIKVKLDNGEKKQIMADLPIPQGGCSTRIQGASRPRVWCT